MQSLVQSSKTIKALSKFWSPSRPARSISSSSQLYSESKTNKSASKGEQPKEALKPRSTSEHPQPQPEAKTVAQADEELRQRLEEMSGEGGAAGLEYEDGKPQTMKRSVRNNMFRYI
ncbi:hypothetical protein BDW72DRAFT_37012 [Aspergillus terricola var. indicus]